MYRILYRPGVHEPAAVSLVRFSNMVLEGRIWITYLNAIEYGYSYITSLIGTRWDISRLVGRQ